MTTLAHRLSFRGCVCCVQPTFAPPRRPSARQRIRAASAGSREGGGVFAAAGAGRTPAASARADAPTTVAAKPHRIDIHHHIAPPKFVAELRDILLPPILGWSVERSLEDMDRAGVA